MDLTNFVRNPSYSSFSNRDAVGFYLDKANDGILLKHLKGKIANALWKLCSQPVSYKKVEAIASIDSIREDVLEVLHILSDQGILLSGSQVELGNLIKPEPAKPRPCGKLLVCMTGVIQTSIFQPYLQLLRSSFCEEIKIVLTESALKFISPTSLKHLLSCDVYTDIFEHNDCDFVPHVFLAEWASCILVAPASASSIHRLATAACNDLLSLTITAAHSTTPIIVGPSMNFDMWSKLTVQRNIEVLKDSGMYIIEPGYGFEVSKPYKDRRSSVGSFGANPLSLFCMMCQILELHRTDDGNHSD